jgi:hypothetical protein
MPKNKPMKAAMGGSVESPVSVPVQPPADQGTLVVPKFGMAKGGKVSNQTQRMLKEGGMMQEGGTVDPVSGNDVPVGAMQEEVRDDIPAQLSEGEFVFPADVVRFIGLERLMMMRQAAKEGLGKMEAMGQMSNADEATMEDDGAFESQIDEIMGELGEEEVRMAEGGVVRQKVGEPTGEMSEAGRPLYKTAEGDTVSEQSITVPFAGEWVNVPSIHDGVRYDDNEIEDMLAAGKIKPTSQHKTLEDAISAAQSRSSNLIKPKMAEGGMVADPAVAQTQQVLAQDQQPQNAALTQDQLTAINRTAEGMKAQQMEVPPEKQSKPTEGLSSADIIRQDASKNKDPAKVESFLQKIDRLAAAKKALILRHNDTVTVGFMKPNGAIDPLVFTKDTPERIAEAAEALLSTARQAGIRRIESNANPDLNIAIFNKLGYPAKKEDPQTGVAWSLDF